MKRRRFLSSVAIILPAAMVSTEVFFSSCRSDVKEEEYFSEENIKLLDEIGETILPASSTSPGAKAARIGEFMKVYVTDCYTTEEQNIFWRGITWIKKKSKNKFGKEFIKLTTSQKQEILKAAENEPQEAAKNEKTSIAGSGDAVQTGKEQRDKNPINGDTPHFYSMIKGLTLFGYFTSEPGATKALRYIQTPGSYRGEVPYKTGDKAWAT
ncbi:MAG TPA: gluconate 2-dehydrogenase subunit 3 family protein [Hanamia sp.]